MDSLSPQSKKNNPEPGERTCPHLGIPGDPTTHYQYPSRINHCLVPSEPGPVQPNHQAMYCLTPAYKQCPVYQRKGLITLPADIAAAEMSGGRPLNKKNGSFWGWVAVVVVILSLVFLIFPLDTPVSVLTTPPPSSTGLAISASTLTVASPTATLTPSPSLTPTLISTLTPTASQSRTLTPTAPLFPTPGPLPGTPFGSEPQFLIYSVQEGESFTSISSRFGTTPDVLAKINILIEGQSLWVGRLIVVGIGLQSAEGLPRFDIVLTREETTMSALADEFSSTIDAIQMFNALGGDMKIPKDRWLIIPVVDS